MATPTPLPPPPTRLQLLCIALAEADKPLQPLNHTAPRCCQRCLGNELLSSSKYGSKRPALGVLAPSAPDKAKEFHFGGERRVALQRCQVGEKQELDV